MSHSDPVSIHSTVSYHPQKSHSSLSGTAAKPIFAGATRQHEAYTETTPPSSPTRQMHNERDADLPTPPSSPVDEQAFLGPAFHLDDSILSAKRDGDLKAVMREYIATKKHGLPMPLRTFQLVLDAHATLRRDGTPLHSMLRVYDDLLQSGFHPSYEINTIMIRTLCKRDVEVQKTVAMLRRQSARTGHSLGDIGCLESEGNLSHALQIFKQAVAIHGQEFEIEMYNQFLRVLSHYGDTTEALFVFGHLERSAFSVPNSATFAAMINLFGRAGDIDAALSYFARYRENKDSMAPHDPSYVYNALVDSHLKCDQTKEALRVLEEDMVRDGIKLTIIPYNSIIRHYCAHHQLDAAKALLEQLKSSPSVLPVPDASSYGPLLAIYCQIGDFESATSVYDALLTTDMTKAYGNLANYALLCLGHDQHLKALAVLEDIRAAHLEPEPALVERVITSIVQAGNIVQAIETLKSALSSMCQRTIAKGISSLSEAATKIALGAQSNLQHVLQVANLIKSLQTGTAAFPMPMAKILLGAYVAQPNLNSLTLQDFDVLYDAVIVARHTTIVGHAPDAEHLVFVLYTHMKRAGHAPDTNLYTRVLSYLQSAGDTKVQQQWRQLFTQELDDGETRPRDQGAADSKAILEAVIHGHIDTAIQTLQHLVDQGIAPLAESMRDAIALAGKQGHIDAALSMYESSAQAFENLMIDENRREHALYLVANSMLVGYAQQGDMIAAKKYYDKIKKMGRFPDGNGYASLLLGTAKCATDEAADALTIYDEAKKHHVIPTTFFFNVVISKLAKARKLESVLRLFDEMAQFKITPNSITYGAVISACVRAGSESNACRLFEEMLASPTYQPRVGPFNNMMQFYIRQQPDRERVLEYYAEMRRRHIKPSAHTYKLLMEAYASMVPYNMPTAHRMLSDMERRDRIRPQANHYATLIYAYGTLQCDVQSAERVFEDMGKRHVQPDEGVYQAMLDTYISNDLLDRAERLYRKMLKTIERSHSPYIENLFIRGYGQKGLLDKAEAVFDAMSDDKLHAQGRRHLVVREPSTFEAMVQAYLDNQRSDKAKDALDRMIRRDFPEKVVAHVASLIFE